MQEIDASFRAAYNALQAIEDQIPGNEMFPWYRFDRGVANHIVTLAQMRQQSCEQIAQDLYQNNVIAPKVTGVSHRAIDGRIHYFATGMPDGEFDIPKEVLQRYIQQESLN